MPPALAAARSNYRLSSLIANRAVTEARKARGQGMSAVASIVAAHQVANAKTSDLAVARMLVEQEIEAVAEATLNTLQFTTAADDFVAMVDAIEQDWQFDQLVDSIVQDAARAAESVAVAVRPNIYHVRFLNPPSCSRCAVLAGRVYRWSEGFLRHPGCDCTMIPTTVASPYVQDVGQLVRDGQVSGLSKDDRLALEDGADFNKVVNVRSKNAGLLEAGHALTSGGRPTPAGIYRLASTREQAVELLRRYRYIT